MKKLIYILSVFVLGACEKPHIENVTEPKYFFHWDREAGIGSCLNEQGVKGYNPRFIGPCGDLRGYDFNLASLDGADLRGAILDGLDLTGFSLNGANLKGAYARGTKFSNAKMNGVKLMYGHFEGSIFKSAELNGADLFKSNMSGTDLQKSSVLGANFAMADLAGAKLPSELTTTNLNNSMISYGTTLPFDEKMAQGKGMKDSNTLYLESAKEKTDDPNSERVPSSLDDTVLEKALASEKSPIR